MEWIWLQGCPWLENHTKTQVSCTSKESFKLYLSFIISFISNKRCREDLTPAGLLTAHSSAGFPSSVQHISLLKLMWNDSNSSHPPPHPPSPVRGVSYCMFTQYCLISFLSLLCPCPLLNAPFALVSLPSSSSSPSLDFLVLTCSAVWRVHDVLTDGCPGLCNNNGRCVLDQNVWHCICQSGWRGLGCDVATETLCSDGKDNEGGREK